MKLSIREFVSTLGFILIVYGVFQFDKTTPFPSLYALIPTFGAATIILYATPDTIVGKLLSSKLFVGIGLVSYSAYLWHQPLFAFTKYHSLNVPSHFFLFGLSLLSFVLAYFSWRYIEQPFRDKKRFTRKSIFILSGIFSVIILVIGLVWDSNQGYEGRFDDDIKNILNAMNDRNPRTGECLNTHRKEYTKPYNACMYGNKGKTIALIGDSHADAIAYTLSNKLIDKKMRLKQMTYSSCPPVIDIHRTDMSSQCSEYNKSVYQYLKDTNEIEHIVFLARWALYLEGSRFDNGEGSNETNHPVLFDVKEVNASISHNNKERKKLVGEKYKQMVVDYLQAGKKVILVYPIPEVGTNVPRMLAKLKFIGGEFANTFTTDHRVFLERNKEVYDIFDSIDEHPNLTRIKPEDILCNTHIRERCITELDGIPLYFDDDHLSNAGASLLSSRIIENITSKK